MKTWCVYILRCRDLSLYTGVTNDLKARLAAHSSGKGAKYTRSRCPVRLVWKSDQPDRSAVTKEEWRIKKLSKTQKEALVKCTTARLV